jgi:hypothetical protein
MPEVAAAFAAHQPTASVSDTLLVFLSNVPPNRAYGLLIGSATRGPDPSVIVFLFLRPAMWTYRHPTLPTLPARRGKEPHPLPSEDPDRPAIQPDSRVVDGVRALTSKVLRPLAPGSFSTRPQPRGALTRSRSS